MITSTFSSDNELSDKEFMVHLYTKYENLLFYTAQKYISERGSVEDVVQESLVKLHEKIRTIKPMPEIVLASYIRSTVRNTAINILKSTRSPNFYRKYNRRNGRARTVFRYSYADIQISRITLKNMARALKGRTIPFGRKIHFGL